MAPHRVAERFRVGPKAADEIACLRLLLALLGINAGHPAKALQVLPVSPPAQVLRYGHRLATPILVAPVIGILGLLLQRYGYPVAPIVLGLILGPMLETHFRRALIVSRGDYTIFLQRPIAAGLLAVAMVYLLLPLFTWVWRRWRIAATAQG
jgi:hypothetical protein